MIKKLVSLSLAGQSKRKALALVEPYDNNDKLVKTILFRYCTILCVLQNV